MALEPVAWNKLVPVKFRLPPETYDSEPPPVLGSWRNVYIFVLGLAGAADRPLLFFYALLRMTPLDWIVMIATMIAIPSFGLWRGRGGTTTSHYLLAGKTMPWYAMGLSIMATQASAITFIATTGQAYVDGMRFVQFYFGLPIAMVILSRDRGAHLSQSRRLHGVRIPRAPVRCQNARAGGDRVS